MPAVKRKTILLTLITLMIIPAVFWSVYGSFFSAKNDIPNISSANPVTSSSSENLINTGSSSAEPLTMQLPNNYLINNIKHTYQTFNNCGPAGLSMLLSYYGINEPQNTIAVEIHPYQHPQGDNDDKSVSFEEFATYIKRFSLESIHRPSGDIDLLKTFIANDVPVLVRAWLNPNDDIGHFRLIRGYDESKRVVIQDDSYHGSKLSLTYIEFLSMWEPFGFEYFVIFPEKDREKIESIIGSDMDINNAWNELAARSEKGMAANPNNPYHGFNLSVASYHLGNYQKTVESFESVESKLPRRMLWYQIEPILGYQKTGQYNKALAKIENILNNGNRAFSELYLVRGEIYLEQGNTAGARNEFEKAVLYNKYYIPAKTALDDLDR